MVFSWTEGCATAHTACEPSGLMLGAPRRCSCHINSTVSCLDFRKDADFVFDAVIFNDSCGCNRWIGLNAQLSLKQSLALTLLKRHAYRLFDFENLHCMAVLAAYHFILRRVGQKRFQHLTNLKQSRIAIMGIVCGVIDAKEI